MLFKETRLQMMKRMIAKLKKKDDEKRIAVEKEFLEQY